MNQLIFRKKGQYFSSSMSSPTNVHVVSLGCVRNTVDSQSISGELIEKGYRIVDLDQSEVVIVNTCSFIEAAREESVDVILELMDLKRKGKIKKLIVAGCLAQRYGSQLTRELKDVDAFVGVFPFRNQSVHSPMVLTPERYAYVKICEGCYHQCNFCIIPKIKGLLCSRTIESVVEEIKQLDEKGIREVNIVGQDITAYGLDLYKEKSLVRLLKEILLVTQNIVWIRLLYMYPTHITDDLIDLIAREERICSYVDVPLQHISNRILRKMNRGMVKEDGLRLIRKLRAKIPNVSLRTTFIVGYPSESEEEFQELVGFVKSSHFERLGVFEYSREEGTFAYQDKEQIPKVVRQKRRKILMQEQRKISEEFQRQFVGKVIRVLIDDKHKDDIYTGRTEFDAPDVDGLVYVHSAKPLHPGDFTEVRINDFLEYDLIGETL